MSRNKPNQELYRPGCGRLRKSDIDDGPHQTESYDSKVYESNYEKIGRNDYQRYNRDRNDRGHDRQNQRPNDWRHSDNKNQGSFSTKQFYNSEYHGNASSRPSSRTGSRSNSRSNSRANSRPQSRAGSRPSSRTGSRAGSRASSPHYINQMGSNVEDERAYRSNRNRSNYNNSYSGNARKNDVPWRNSAEKTSENRLWRDTRSQEPALNQRHSRPPPADRRHSMAMSEAIASKLPQNFDNWAPRLQKKWLAELNVNTNILNEHRYKSNDHVYDYQSQSNHPYQNDSTQPNSNTSNFTMPPPPVSTSWSTQTLPSRNGRGRGRFTHMTHSNSFGGNFHDYPSHNRPSERVNSDKNDLSAISDQNIPESFAKIDDSGDIGASNQSVNQTPVKKRFDWCEEVEANSELFSTAVIDRLLNTISLSQKDDRANDGTDNGGNSVEDRHFKKNSRGKKRSDGNSNRSRDASYDRQGNYRRDRYNSGGYQSRDGSRTRQNQNRDGGRRGNERNDRNERYERYDNRNNSQNRGVRSHDTKRGDSPSNVDSNNWRRGSVQPRRTSECDDAKMNGEIPDEGRRVPSVAQAPGILILQKDNSRKIHMDASNVSRYGPTQSDSPRSPTLRQKMLYDPNNPGNPTVVIATARDSPIFDRLDDNFNYDSTPHYLTDSDGISRPEWYTVDSPAYRLCQRNQKMIVDISRIDVQLQVIVCEGNLVDKWENVRELRGFLLDSLKVLLETDLRFCGRQNVEKHFWNILYHNIIGKLREKIAADASNEFYKTAALSLIDEGFKYYGEIITLLENTHNFKVEDVIQRGRNDIPSLVLVSTQKIYLCLGDLARYKEEINKTTSYGRAKQFYTKSQQLYPRNGRPFHQLAIIASLVKRRLDAVYYFIRSLMASQPYCSAKQRLVCIFEEISRKYLQMRKYMLNERKRRDERLQKAKSQLAESYPRRTRNSSSTSLRREIWIRPDGGRRLHRTTPASVDSNASCHTSDDDDDLTKLSSKDVNNRFITSYLYVQGKLLTKIEMESFNDAAIKMLKEFRTLLQFSPLPINAIRLIQLLTINIYTIEITQQKIKEAQNDSREYWTGTTTRALIVALQMFNLILERTLELLETQLSTNCYFDEQSCLLPDLLVCLPALKVWCDWMSTHVEIWNPPPHCFDYRVGPPGCTWTRLATLINCLRRLRYPDNVVTEQPMSADFQPLRLIENVTLSGFLPLQDTFQTQNVQYASETTDNELAESICRIDQLLRFGTTFLCQIKPPVLQLRKHPNGYDEYVSVVDTSSKNVENNNYTQQSDPEILLESFSEDESAENDRLERKLSQISHASDLNTPLETKELLQRKEELEERHKHLKKYSERVQAILQQSVVSVEIEVRPRLLVPDTNCFIDYLPHLQAIVNCPTRIDSQPIYILNVPLVVIHELEGLARGGKQPLPRTRVSLDQTHVAKVAEASERALGFLRMRSVALRWVTTAGKVMASNICSLEEDGASEDVRNDDRILATSLNLCRASIRDSDNDDEPRRRFREVVLLTDDRNLRVKALARDMPVRELPDFIKWAGLS